MKTFMLNGVEFCNFGRNNYSNGMECITCYPMPENMVERVLNGEFHGVWLNPSAECSEGSEFYGVFGTPEQYYGRNENKGFLNRQRDSIKAVRYINAVGGISAMEFISEKERHEIKARIDAEYRDWWECR